MSFLKNLFGGAPSVAPIVENNTEHPNPKLKDLNGVAFKKELLGNDQAVLLDVRTAMEYRMGALPEAQLLDFMSPGFTQKAGALDRSKTYFLYCRSGNRSGQACQLMHQMGFDVRNLAGGIGAYPG